MSGANLAMVVAAVFGILAWLRVGIRCRALVSAIALLAFVILARPSPSVMRAAIMGLLALAAIGLGRPRMLTSAAFVAVTLLSLFDPMLVGQPGFALSVLATLALVLVAPGWTGAISARLPARLRPVAAGAAVALAAQAACAPVLAAINGGISLVSVPANVIALPAVPPATVLGLAAALTSLVSPAAAGLICDLAGVPCWWLIHVARWAQQLPMSHLTTPTGAWGFVVVLMLDAAVVLAVRRRSGRRTVAFAVISLVAVSLASGSPATGSAT